MIPQEQRTSLAKLPSMDWLSTVANSEWAATDLLLSGKEVHSEKHWKTSWVLLID